MGSTNRKSAGGRGVGNEIINATREQQAAPASTHWRKRAVAALIAAAVAAIAAPVTAQEVIEATATQSAEAAHDYSIPAGTLADALHRFSEQSGLQVFFESELVNGKTAPELNTRMPAQEALNTLLAGSGLIYEFVNNRTLILRRSPDAAVQVEGAAATDVTTALAEGSLISDENITTESVTSSQRRGIEEIIVTARKREESVQDIPISITALSSEDIKAMGIRNMGDMEGIVPGLNMSGGGNGVKKDNNPFIRGIGQRETKVTLDPAVGTYIDGIYLSRPSGGLADVASVESIQVLRGPQGTLFGRNTTGGAISITTKKPNNDWSAQIGASVGNYGRSDVTVALNAPIIKDTLLSRLTVSSRNSDGYFTNVNDNTLWGGDNRITAIAQLRWLPTSDLTFDVLGERTRIRETPRPQKCAVIRPYSATGQGTNPNVANYNPNYFAPTPLRTTNVRRAETGLPSFQDLCEQSAAMAPDRFSSDLAVGDMLMPEARYWVDTSTAGVTGTWDIGDLGFLSGLQAKSISAWREVSQIADEDIDAVGAPYLVRVQPDFTKSTQWSQELQLTGRTFHDRLFFSTGLYYFGEKTPQDDLLLLAGIAQGAPATQADGSKTYTVGAYEPVKERLKTDNEAYAWFGQLDFDVTSQLQATAGLRYTEEKRWSRYEKQVADSKTVVNGWLSGLTLTGLSVFTASQPGFNPILDWQYGARVYDYAYYPNGNKYVSNSIVPGQWVGDELSTKDSAWTPTFSLKYKADGELLDALHLSTAMIYATYSIGFHSGGVTSGAVDYDIGTRWEVRPDGSINYSNQLLPEEGFGTADPIIFRPEKVKNYEIGLKATSRDRSVQANLAVFYMDYTNMQLSSVGMRDGIPIPFIENAGKAVIQGVEAEFIFMPTPQWRVMTNASYTDADIKEWQSAQFNLGAGSGNPLSAPTYMDRSDEPMPRVPEWQAFLMTDYGFNLRNGSTVTPSIAFRYSSEIYQGFDRGSFVHGRDIVTSDKNTFIDARLSWVSSDGLVEIAAWGKNLTNEEDYIVGAIALADVTGGTGLIFANPRTFGLNLSYNFGAAR